MATELEAFKTRVRLAIYNDGHDVISTCAPECVHRGAGAAGAVTAIPWCHWPVRLHYEHEQTRPEKLQRSCTGKRSGLPLRIQPKPQKGRGKLRV